MGIAERKEREKLELRSKILEAANKMLAEEGYENTSLRKIAKAIEYSAGTIYLHFKNKDELFFAIHEEGFNLLFERLSPAMEIENPVDRLRNLGERYLQFAADHPDYYDLMFLQRGPMNFIQEELDPDGDEAKAAKWAAVRRSFGCLYQTIHDLIEQGYLPGRDLNTTTFFVWSTMHGMTALSICKRLENLYPENHIPDLMNQTMTMLQDMMIKKKD